MDRYYVLGNPIAHSRSPRIHSAFAAALGQELSYEARLVPMEGFAREIELLKQEGFRGCNVTVPFKEQAFRAADRLSDRASLAGAVNTLSYDGGILSGDNTDGEGLARDLACLGVPLEGRSVLLLGAGGAARGIVASLLLGHPRRLHIANRTVSRAGALADLARSSPMVGSCDVSSSGFEEAEGDFDLIINATSASLSGEIPPFPGSLLHEGVFAYDLMYAPEDTPFVARARSLGAGAADGLGMLVEQAAESFRIWRGVRPDTADLKDRLRQEMRRG